MLMLAERSSRQVAGSILGLQYHYFECPEFTKFFHYASTRQIHNDNTTIDAIHVYDTSGDPGFESDGVTLGLLSSLAKFKPGLGYFCPIDRSTRRGYKSEIFREILKSNGGVHVKQGVTMERAYELMTMDKRDDLLEEILGAYMTFRENHDFVVLEGTQLKGFQDDALDLNVNIAYTLNATSLLVANARRAFEINDRNVEVEKSDWKRTLIDNIKVNELAFKRNHVDVMGAIVYDVPQLTKNNNSLLNLFDGRRITYFGGIPEDCVLHSCQIKDIAAKLDAEVLHGVDLSTEVTKFVLATSSLSDFLLDIQKYMETPHKIVVLTAANRLDILFGIVQLHKSDNLKNVVAIVVTGGRPSQFFDLLLKDKNSHSIFSVLASPCTLFETALALGNLRSEISSDMPHKILRALTLFTDNFDLNIFKKSLQQEKPERMNPKMFQYSLFSQAKKERQHIVLPEGEEPRTIQAVGTLLKKKLCSLTLLGDPSKINYVANQFQVDLQCAHIINPLESPLRDKYATMLYEYRKEKGVTKENAYDLAKDVMYFGTLMVAAGDVDGMVSGAIHTTADTIRPALQIIKTEPGLTASSVIFMCLKDKVQVFADCAVNIEPTSKELAGIAVASAKTAIAFGIKPLVAMLSYATGDSNDGPLVQRVRDAKNLALQLQPNLCVEGPIQYDAAVNLKTAKIKLKGRESTVAGKANILIFPDLNTGNVTYKAVQQSSGAIVMGPLLQGLHKPVNDLSRGCTVDDIVSTVAMTSLQAASQKKKQTSTK